MHGSAQKTDGGGGGAGGRQGGSLRKEMAHGKGSFTRNPPVRQSEQIINSENKEYTLCPGSVPGNKERSQEG